jgi:hypothetical protein
MPRPPANLLSPPGAVISVIWSTTTPFRLSLISAGQLQVSPWKLPNMAELPSPVRLAPRPPICGSTIA